MGWHHSTHWGPKCDKKVKEEWILFISSWAGMSISSCLQIWEILVLRPLDSRIYTSGPWFSYPTGFPSSAASRLQTVGLLNLQNRMSQCPLSSSYMSVYPRLVLFLWTTLADTGTSQSRQQRAWAWSWLSPWAAATAPGSPGMVIPPSFSSQGPVLSLVIVSSLNSENDSFWVYLFSPLSVSCWGHDWWN